MNIVLIKDYIKNPKPNGYQSLHLHIEIPVYLSSGVVYTRIEVQVRTIAMDFWASLEHKIYYKFRNEAPKKMTDQLKLCANMISTLDKRMLSIKNEMLRYDEDKASGDYDETLNEDVISSIDLGKGEKYGD